MLIKLGLVQRFTFVIKFGNNLTNHTSELPKLVHNFVISVYFMESV